MDAAGVERVVRAVEAKDFRHPQHGHAFAGTWLAASSACPVCGAMVVPLVGRAAVQCLLCPAVLHRACLSLCASRPGLIPTCGSSPLSAGTADASASVGPEAPEEALRAGEQAGSHRAPLFSPLAAIQRLSSPSPPGFGAPFQGTDAVCVSPIRSGALTDEEQEQQKQEEEEEGEGAAEGKGQEKEEQQEEGEAEGEEVAEEQQTAPALSDALEEAEALLVPAECIPLAGQRFRLQELRHAGMIVGPTIAGTLVGGVIGGPAGAIIGMNAAGKATFAVAGRPGLALPPA